MDDHERLGRAVGDARKRLTEGDGGIGGTLEAEAQLTDLLNGPHRLCRCETPCHGDMPGEAKL